jgi:hypothetical protein
MDDTTIEIGLYQHYKGQHYQVLGLARHSETLEPMVVYQALYADYRLWVRPLAMFHEKVLWNNEEIPRFKFINKTVTALPAVRKKSN